MQVQVLLSAVQRRGFGDFPNPFFVVKCCFAEAERTNNRSPILYICDFSRGVLNVRLNALTSNTCSEATNIEDWASVVLSVTAEVKVEFKYS